MSTISSKKNAPSASPPEPGARRDRHTVEGRCRQLLEALQRHHKGMELEGSFKAFQSFAWRGFNGELNKRKKGDDFIRALLKASPKAGSPMPTNPAASARWIALFAATAYCVEAINASGSGDSAPEIDDYGDDPQRFTYAMESHLDHLREAWDYAFDAAQWEGLLVGLLHGPEDAAAAMLKQFRERSKLGGKKSAATRSTQAKADAVKIVSAAERLGWPKVHRGINGKVAEAFKWSDEKVRKTLEYELNKRSGSFGK